MRYKVYYRGRFRRTVEAASALAAGSYCALRFKHWDPKRIEVELVRR